VVTRKAPARRRCAWDRGEQQCRKPGRSCRSYHPRRREGNCHAQSTTTSCGRTARAKPRSPPIGHKVVMGLAMGRRAGREKPRPKPAAMSADGGGRARNPDARVRRGTAAVATGAIGAAVQEHHVSDPVRHQHAGSRTPAWCGASTWSTCEPEAAGGQIAPAPVPAPLANHRHRAPRSAFAARTDLGEQRLCGC